MQSITILGATGSIGVSTLDVLARHPDKYKVYALSAHGRVDELAAQCQQFRPARAVVGSADAASRLAALLRERAAVEGEQAFLGIQIRPHARDTANDFVHKALALPETLALYNVSGSEDYLVHVAVANSTELQTLIIDKLLALPQVAHCRTQLIFGEPWVAPLRHRPGLTPDT